jgi:transcriptional regulator GlxA family with amidase domain
MATVRDRLAAARRDLERSDARCRRSGDELMRRAQRRLRALAPDRAPIDRLAAELGTSRSELYRRFRAAAGMSPHDYRLLARLVLAYELAPHLGGSCETIARAAGIGSARGLRRLTRQWLDGTPSEVIEALGRPTDE